MDKYMIDLDQILDELEAEESQLPQPLPISSTTLTTTSTTSISNITSNNNINVNISLPSISPSTSNVMDAISNDNSVIQNETISPFNRDGPSSSEKISCHKNSSSSTVMPLSHDLLSDNLTVDEDLWSYDTPSLPSNSLKSPLHNENKAEEEEKNKQQSTCDEATVTACDSYGDEELLRKVLEDVDEYEKYNLTSTDDLNFNLQDSDVNVTGDDLEAELNAIINSVSLSSSNFTQSSNPSSLPLYSSPSSSVKYVSSEESTTNAFSSQSSGNNSNNSDQLIGSTFSQEANSVSGPNGILLDEDNPSFSPHPFDSDPVNDLTSPLKPCAVVRPNSLNLPTHESQGNNQVSSESGLEEPSVIERASAVVTPPLVSVSAMDDEPRVGYVRPFWVPDREALSCMRCDTKFNVIKRRHHCRACGKVLCNNCCNMRAKLAYLDFQEDRVCSICYHLLTTDDYYGENTPTNGLQGVIASSSNQEQQEQQQQQTTSNPTPLPPGVLKKPNQPPKQPKQVIFSDGIRPGGDLTEPEGSTSNSIPKKTLSRLRSPPVEVNSLPSKLSKGKPGKPLRTKIEDSLGELPPVLNCPALAADPTLTNLMSLLTCDEPLTFGLTKNLHIQLKITKLDCCCDCQVWNFSSRGLATVGQDEISLILEIVDGETSVPRAAFRLILAVYDKAYTGNV